MLWVTSQNVLPIWENPPDFINESGVKWWHEQKLTDYAASRGFPDISAWIVQHPDSKMNRVLIRNNEIEFEDTTIEGICMHIDMMRAAETTEGNKQ